VKDDEARWKFYDPGLLWLFPGSYALHVLEESTVNAPIVLWNTRLDRPLDALALALLNLLGLVMMSLGVHLVGRSARYHWIAPAIATEVLLNTLGHLTGSIVAREYSAGLVTAVIFWVPLGTLTLLRVATQSTARTLFGGAAVALVIEAIVTLTLSVLADGAAEAPPFISRDSRHL
jgi:hypothetical protein